MLPANRSQEESGQRTGSSTSSANPELAPRETRRLRRGATDDEILGINCAPRENSSHAEQLAPVSEDAADAENPARKTAGTDATDLAQSSIAGEPEHLRDALDANPELRAAWREAQAYRETFATPEEAHAATALLSDLNRMDALFFSGRAEDHAELARAVANLDPKSFESLAEAMSGLAAETRREQANRTRNSAPETSTGVSRAEPGGVNQTDAPSDENEKHAAGTTANAAPTQAQAEFFHAANISAVEGVLAAIESQVERLLPSGVSKTARNRVVGEIYRELDATLRSNRDLARQMREAFRSGSLDADHQRAVVSLITGRARQALPGVAKRVLNEWTSTLVAANQEQRARQRTAERRVDISGAGGAANDGRRSISSRDIDYGRMSDADILNL
jgi:hypothetical protein